MILSIDLAPSGHGKPWIRDLTGRHCLASTIAFSFLFALPFPKGLLTFAFLLLLSGTLIRSPTRRPSPFFALPIDIAISIVRLLGLGFGLFGSFGVCTCLYSTLLCESHIRGSGSAEMLNACRDEWLVMGLSRCRWGFRNSGVERSGGRLGRDRSNGRNQPWGLQDWNGGEERKKSRSVWCRCLEMEKGAMANCFSTQGNTGEERRTSRATTAVRLRAMDSARACSAPLGSVMSKISGSF
jgi:hypothetical protein